MVRKIFEAFCGGKSCNGIAVELNKGIFPSHAHSPFIFLSVYEKGRINDELKSAGVYAQPQWRLIQAWLDTGNAAAPGRFAEYSQEDVGSNSCGRLLAVKSGTTTVSSASEAVNKSLCTGSKIVPQRSSEG